MASGHEQAVALGAAEAKIGAALGQVDVRQRFSLTAKDPHAVVLDGIGAWSAVAAEGSKGVSARASSATGADSAKASRKAGTL